MSERRGAARLPASLLGRGLTYAAAAAALSLVAIALAAEVLSQDVLARAAAIPPAALAGLLGLSLLNYVARALRWQIYARCVGAAIGFGLTLLYYVAGFALTLTPGKLGEALRLWFLRQHHGLRYERTAPILIADRVSDAVALATIAVVAALTQGRMLLVAAPAALAIALGVMLLAQPRLALRLISAAYGRIGRWPRFFARLRTVLRMTAALASPGTLLPGTAIALLGWLAEALAFYWVLLLLGAEIGPAMAAFIFALAMLAGAAAMLPGGLGGTELTMVALLDLAGVGTATAVAATAVIRATTLWFACGLGFVALPVAVRGPWLKHRAVGLQGG